MGKYLTQTPEEVAGYYDELGIDWGYGSHIYIEDDPDESVRACAAGILIAKHRGLNAEKVRKFEPDYLGGFDHIDVGLELSIPTPLVWGITRGNDGDGLEESLDDYVMLSAEAHEQFAEGWEFGRAIRRLAGGIDD